MRTDLNSGGFTLYEILFSNIIVGIKTELLSVTLSSLLDRFVYLKTLRFNSKTLYGLRIYWR